MHDVDWTSAAVSGERRWPPLFILAAILLVAAGMERPSGAEAASLNVSWQSPTTNADGTPLTDLAGYRLYVGTSTPACRGSSPFVIASSVAAPSQPQAVTYQVGGLTAGTTYAVAVTAVNLEGIEGQCSKEAVGVAQPGFTVTPSSVDFGSAVVGTSADSAFTLQNVSGLSLTGTAMVSSPFTIVSGSAYNVAPNATQNIVVRFPPTSAGTFLGNVNFAAGGDTLSRGVTGTGMLPTSPPPPGTAAISLAYNGKLRDRVGTGSTALRPDGVLDGTLTAALSASGGRTITALALQSSGAGSWDTRGTSAWVLGVATTLDGPLLNDPSTMAVNFAVADGGSFHLFFASAVGGVDFVAGATLTLTATFSDGTTATAVTTVPVPPPSLSLTYAGKLRDRVGPGNVALGPDGLLDGTLTATLHATGGRTVTRLQLLSSGPGTWDTDGAAGSGWVLGVATTLDGAPLNDPVTMAVNFAVAAGASFELFAADYAGLEFAPGTTLTLTATFSDGTTATATTATGTPPSLTLTYNGKLRDRVGPGNAALGPDGALDGTLTATLSASGGRAVTRLVLQSTGPGVWDTDGATGGGWVLGVAATLDSPLLNDPATMAVNLAMADGETFQLFASDSAGVEFAAGATLTLTATFSDGTAAVGTVVVPPSLTLTYNGKLRDRVGAGNVALGPDGVMDGTFTAMLSAKGGRTITRLVLLSSAPGTWDTDGAAGAGWVLGVATTLDAPLLNNAATMAVNFPVASGGSFQLFAADYAGTEFAPGARLTLTATFSDGTTAAGTVVIPPSLTLTYNGKLRDRVGAGNIALGPDGVMDGTFTVVLRANGGRTITRLALQSTAPGTWDTDGTANPAWVLGVATTLDGPLLNNLATMAVNFPVADGGSFQIFASDYAGVEFAQGATLTLTATFSDGTTATATVTVTAVAASALTVTYSGKLRDRVGLGNLALGPDGALDGTLTATLNASGGRTITRVQLQSNASGSWDSNSAGHPVWVLGVANTLDGPLLNDPVTMAVNFPVATGGTFVLFASDFAGIEFTTGAILTLTATFSDGTTATATTTVVPMLTLTYNGKLRDRVSPGNLGLGPDGVLDGTLTATLSASGGRTVTELQLQSSAPGDWDTGGPGGQAWVLGAATSLDGALLNDPTTMAVNFPVADGGSFELFASDYAGIEFSSGVTLTLTASFSDGTSLTATVTVP